MVETQSEVTHKMPEPVQVAMQLENIFTPHFRQKRDSAYKFLLKIGSPQPYAKFVHYTTAEAALNIIQNKKIWMRKTTCMSDFLEVEHGFDLLRKFFGDETRRKRFQDAIDPCALGATEEAIALFDSHFNIVKSNTYIASVSQHNEEEDQHGRLSMWRAFGGATGRVAIVFRLPWYSDESHKAIDALQFRFSPVCYLDEDDFSCVFDKTIENILAHKDFLCSIPREVIVNNIFNMLLLGAVCSKHIGFREEREWRVMYFPTLWASTLMKDELKVIGGIPQKIFNIPLDIKVAPALAGLDLSNIFEQVIIGPTEYPSAMHEAFSDALTRIGIKDASTRVVISNIPIRT
jgi:hypothetical protein